MRMSSSHKQLPPRFADLEPFADWALADESERLRLRLATPMHEIETFYNTMLPQIEEVLEYLTGFSIETFDETQQRLLYMALSLAEISTAVELYGQSDHPFGIDMTRFVRGST